MILPDEKMTILPEEAKHLAHMAKVNRRRLRRRRDTQQEKKVANGLLVDEIEPLHPPKVQPKGRIIGRWKPIRLSGPNGASP